MIPERINCTFPLICLFFPGPSGNDGTVFISLSHCCYKLHNEVSPSSIKRHAKLRFFQHLTICARSQCFENRHPLFRFIMVQECLSRRYWVSVISVLNSCRTSKDSVVLPMPTWLHPSCRNHARKANRSAVSLRKVRISLCRCPPFTDDQADDQKAQIHTYPYLPFSHEILFKL